MNSTIKPTSYADKTKKKIVPIINIDNPTDEQGLIFNHVGENKIRDYLLAISQLVGGPQNIVAASRVSGGKVIVFLSSKELVLTFQEQHGGFQLDTTFIPTSKLKAPATKLVISNVSPTIPNAALEDVLVNTLHLKLASPISFLRVSPNDDVFSHVISWRRQVYLSPNADCSQIPPTAEITHANRTYRIFFSSDNLACFKCGIKGHKAEDCTQIFDEEVDDQLSLTAKIANDIPTEPTPPLSEFPPLAIKRSTPSISSSVANQIDSTLIDIDNLQIQDSSTKPASKKAKIDAPPNQAEQLPPTSSTSTQNLQNDIPALTPKQLADQLKPLYADPVKYKPPMTIENLAVFIDSCKNPTKDVGPNMQKYNINATHLIPLLQKSHSVVQNAKSKSRITRILSAITAKIDSKT